MPSTPNWAIPYPCSGDNIDCTIFEDFTVAIQTAITTLDTLTTTALRRPTAKITGSGQAIAAGATTNATFSSEEFDTAAMANLGVNNDRLTVTSDGMYMITAWSDLGSPFTTMTSNSVAISVNGTIIYRKKNSSDTNLDMNVTVTGLYNCVVGDIIRMPILWTGTGGPLSTFSSTLSALRVALP